ncbi:MAG: non-canonical purine NTP pyrophosphatase [Clostridia bacterium]|nr:non-canonical purine NTP pyrophosphatase [Clostridia bacterium]MBQ8513178.1 non-canonical purine NTP pyrophosphatase [Clostridia bacterium]
MTEIVLASNNKKKIAELETLLGSASSNGVKLLSLKDIGFTDDIDENGSTFEENSIIKASVPAKLGYIGIADDSGLAVDFLGGAPGIYSARYSGEGATDESNRKKLLGALKDVPAEKRTAKFVCTASVVLPEECGLTVPAEWRISEELAEKAGLPAERVMVVRGECHGVILTEEHGEGGFGYDSLFFYPAFGQTFAEIPQEKKNTVSHRGNAMREFTQKLAEIIR